MSGVQFLLQPFAKLFQRLAYTLRRLLARMGSWADPKFERALTFRIVNPVRTLATVGEVNPKVFPAFTISSTAGNGSEIILDYGRCVGGIPVFEVSKVSGRGAVEFDVIYSESREGIDTETGKTSFSCRVELATLTLTRRWTLLPVFKCYEHISSRNNFFCGQSQTSIP